MLHPLKITSTLADETRYQIYEYMLKHKKNFTVQNIADEFSIHPNVARLHLTKLHEINVITADYVKTGKGGRPGRVYKTTEQGVSLTFPKRDEPLLLNWLLQLVDTLGEEAIEKVQEISYSDGHAMMKTMMLSKEVRSNAQTFDEKIKLLTDSAAMIGYTPVVEQVGNVKKIQFVIYNCPFQNQLPTYSKISCLLHESYLRGQVDALFLSSEFLQIGSMIHECDVCTYEITVPNNE
ncbi:helix-turn-helix domain-containing protein [Solibacillus sp. CAU 1738]|uniref:helix-turn-helix transcriptional regulator n=1 Tax=Solibacillus sp. CAU 1738 TaxID=3140363 RepID=UPI003261A245